MANYNERFVLGVYEEAAPPVHYPVILGNEYYVLTQHDKRRVEDVRELTYSPWVPPPPPHQPPCPYMVPTAQAPGNMYSDPYMNPWPVVEDYSAQILPGEEWNQWENGLAEDSNSEPAVETSDHEVPPRFPGESDDSLESWSEEHSQIVYRSVGTSTDDLMASVSGGGSGQNSPEQELGKSHKSCQTSASLTGDLGKSLAQLQSQDKD